MISGQSFQNLMQQLRAGDEEAARQVFQMYAGRLIPLAQKKLDVRIRRKVDPEDVTQSVFRSFFRRHQDGQFDLNSPGSLWGLLTVITLRKCGNKAEQFMGHGRDVRREISIGSPQDSAAAWEVIAREPTPAEAAMLSETIVELMRDLEPRDRTIVEQALQGYTPAEISQQIDRTERTVRRVLQRIRAHLEGMSA